MSTKKSLINGINLIFYQLLVWRSVSDVTTLFRVFFQMSKVLIQMFYLNMRHYFR